MEIRDPKLTKFTKKMTLYARAQALSQGIDLLGQKWQVSGPLFLRVCDGLL